MEKEYTLVVWIIADLICTPGRTEWDHGSASHGFSPGVECPCGQRLRMHMEQFIIQKMRQLLIIVSKKQVDKEIFNFYETMCTLVLVPVILQIFKYELLEIVYLLVIMSWSLSLLTAAGYIPKSEKRL